MSTGSLFDEGDVLEIPRATTGREVIPRPAKLTIQEAFEQWWERNPKYEILYVRFTREAIAAGYTQFSTSAITERIRWEVTVGTNPEHREEFKISNNYRSRIARYLMKKYPEFEGFFELRSLREEGAEHLDEVRQGE